ncbi:MAG: energy transducer TonB [Alistipes sp.]|nr:energy transducer TonB [Alistipes sp.]
MICNKMMMQKSNNNTKKSNSYRRNILLEDTRRESLGEWLYNHRIGVMVVILTLLVGGTWLATARYSFTIPPMEYFVEFVEEVPSEAEVAELKRKRDELQAEIDRRLQEVQNVKNLQSNDAAETSGSKSQLGHDAKTQELMDKIASDMQTNRNDYESGMREVADIGKGGEGEGSGDNKGDGDKGKFSGAVTVAYNFADPVRHHRDLYIPAYKTKGGGVVVVDVWLDRNGTVTSARIQSSTNSELNAQALAAARHRRTLFRIDGTAPESHRGTITYTFVAQ